MKCGIEFACPSLNLIAPFGRMPALWTCFTFRYKLMYKATKMPSSNSPLKPRLPGRAWRKRMFGRERGILCRATGPGHSTLAVTRIRVYANVVRFRQRPARTIANTRCFLGWHHVQSPVELVSQWSESKCSETVAEGSPKNPWPCN